MKIQTDPGSVVAACIKALKLIDDERQAVDAADNERFQFLKGPFIVRPE